MKKLGKVLHVSAQNRIIVKSEKNVSDIGADVINKELKIVGKIFDIFGSIKSPYISIIAETSKILNAIKEGEILYLKYKNVAKKRPTYKKNRKKSGWRKKFGSRSKKL